MANPASDTSDRIVTLLARAKELACEYYALTGRPLGVTGEVAEYEATRLLNLTLAPPRQDGYDAIRITSDGRTETLQIKGRQLSPRTRPGGQRVGALTLEKEWDKALLVLLDDRYDAYLIYEADREPLVAALSAPGSKARNVRGQLAVSKFIALGKVVWRRD